MSVPADRDTSADVTVSSAAAGDGADDGDISTEELLAELAAEGGDDDGAADGGKKPAGKPGKKPAPPADDDDEDEDQEDEDDGEGPSDEDEDDEEEEDEDEEDPDDENDEEEGDDELEGKAAKDPALAKRLAAVRRTEQRSRDRIERERAAFEQEKSAWQVETKTLREEVQRFRALAARATYDPASVLKALGVSEDDMEYAGKQVYARSKAAAAKPDHRAAADQAMREREHVGELAKTQSELAELRKQLETRDQQAAQEREADQYMSRVVRKASDATPRVMALIAKSPKRARIELGRTAFELAQKLGSGLPPAKAVLAAHEKKIARQLRAYGVDSATPDNAGKKPNGSGGAPAGAKPAGKPGKPGKPGDKPNAGAKRSARNEIEHPSAADLIRELAEGALDADT